MLSDDIWILPFVYSARLFSSFILFHLTPFYFSSLYKEKLLFRCKRLCESLGRVRPVQFEDDFWWAKDWKRENVPSRCEPYKRLGDQEDREYREVRGIYRGQSLGSPQWPFDVRRHCQWTVVRPTAKPLRMNRCKCTALARIATSDAHRRLD